MSCQSRQLALFQEPERRLGGLTEDDGWPEDDDGDEAENRAFCSAYTAIVRDRLGDDGFVSLARRLVRGGL